MTFALVIDTDNAAFAGRPESEVARILRDVATELEGGFVKGPVYDFFGNPVGKFVLKHDSEEE